MVDKANKSELNRENRLWYAEHGICNVCGQTWAEPGRKRCKACYAKALAGIKRRDPTGEKHKVFVKALRDYRREHGLCIDCGAPNDGVHTRCKRCVKKSQESTRMYKLRKRIKSGKA